jgi:hypothetical protein
LYAPRHRQQQLHALNAVRVVVAGDQGGECESVNGGRARRAANGLVGHVRLQCVEMREDKYKYKDNIKIKSGEDNV